MTALCVTPIKGTTMRVMGLNTCGGAVTGAASAVIVEAGFISAKPSPQYEEGTEFTQKTANGILCVNQKDPGQLKRVMLDTLWCIMDPDLIVVMTGSRLITSGATTGTGAFFNDSVISPHFSLEIWQQVAGRNACNAAGLQQYVYWAFPHVNNAQVGDWTVENAALQFNLKAETLAVGTPWGGFPTASPPSLYLSGGAFVAGEHYAYNVSTNAPPAAGCGAVTIS